MLSLARLGLVTRCPGLTRGLTSTAVLGVRGPTPAYREERIAVTEDGAVLACWHPPPNFPYEMSRALPVQDSATSSPLKVTVTEDMKELYHHKHERFARRDLMRITWTTKHKWFPSKRRTWKEIDEKKNPREKPYM